MRGRNGYKRFLGMGVSVFLCGLGHGERPLRRRADSLRLRGLESLPVRFDS